MIIVAKKKNDEQLTPMQYLFNQTVGGSVPFNWKLYRALVDRGYRGKRAQEAVLLFGYLVSWQSLFTGINRLRKGFFFRSQGDITRDTGLTKQAQQKVIELLEGEGLISMKRYPGQSNRFKVNIDAALKYLDRAQKLYTTRTENDQEPGPEVPTNNIKKHYSNDQGKGGEELRVALPITTMQPISFFEFKKEYIDQGYFQSDVNNEIELSHNKKVTALMEYFLEKHANTVGPGKHKKLKAATWIDQFYKMMIIDDEDHITDLENYHVDDMIDHYFKKAQEGKYKAVCDYSIVHFNHPRIKEVNFYEACY